MQTMNTMVCFPKATETNFPPGFTKCLASGIYVTLFIPFSLVHSYFLAGRSEAMTNKRLSAARVRLKQQQSKKLGQLHRWPGSRMVSRCRREEPGCLSCPLGPAERPADHTMAAEALATRHRSIRK